MNMNVIVARGFGLGSIFHRIHLWEIFCLIIFFLKMVQMWEVVGGVSSGGILVREGEKMSEELLADGEILTDTNHPKLKTAKCRPVDEELIFHIESEFMGLNNADDLEIKKKLRKLIPEYKPL